MARETKIKMFENPQGKMADWDFGWLRTEAKGAKNSAAALAFNKLTLGQHKPGASWERRCWKAEILLPAGAPDLLDNPQLLFERIDATMPAEGRRDLALVLTWWTPGARSLHAAWEEVRSFVRKQLVDARELPALLVQHAPHAAGQTTPPHIHAVVGARRLTFDLAAFTELEGDAAQTVLWEEWKAHAGLP